VLDRLCLQKNGQDQIIAETGAGQHAATATAAALMIWKANFMGKEDTSVNRSRLLDGAARAKVNAVTSGT
jgi:tryptophan synthase beta subunit